MIYFKVPAGIEAISVGGLSKAVSEGFIAFEDGELTAEMETSLKDHVKATVATEEEVSALSATQSAAEEAAATKADVVAKLRAAGVKFDARANAATLAKLLAEPEKPAPAAEPATPAS